MKKRILRDPDTGEIIGATKAPFLKAKLEEEFNEELRKKEGNSGGDLTNDEAFSKDAQPSSVNTYEQFQPTGANRTRKTLISVAPLINLEDQVRQLGFLYA